MCSPTYRFLVCEDVWWSGSTEVKGRGFEEVPDHWCPSGLQAQECKHEAVHLQQTTV